jgi:hypothetical protein
MIPNVSFEEIAKYVLIPCLVYYYKTFKDMQRHSIEDNKFSVKPSNDYLDSAERMTEEETDSDLRHKELIPRANVIAEKRHKEQEKEAKKRELEIKEHKKRELKKQLEALEKGEHYEPQPSKEEIEQTLREQGLL